MKVEDSLVDYAHNFIKEICEKFGPRYSSSEQEKKANLWIKDEFSKYCNETFLEEFKTRPNLYPQGLLKVSGFYAGISFVFIPLRFPFPILSAIFILLALFTLFTELFLMKRWINFFFKKGTSSNVIGIIKPLKDVKYRIVFDGHTDSAKQMKIAEYERKPPKIHFFLGIAYLFYTLVLSFIKFFTLIFLGELLVQYEFGIIQWTVIDWIYFIPWLILFPFFLWVLRGFLGETVVDGANDNLSGSAICGALGKYFSQNRPNNIEIIIASMGSEEIGDRGAKDFVAKHGDLLEDSYAFILDSVGAGSEFLIVEKDFMHFTKYSPEVVSLMEEAYERYKKENPDTLPCRRGKIPLGSSDACMYSKAGYHAAFLIAIASELKKPTNWHSVHDTWQNINKKVLKDAIGICLNFVDILDNEFEK